MKLRIFLIFLLLFGINTSSAFAQNPDVSGQFRNPKCTLCSPEQCAERGGGIGALRNCTENSCTNNGELPCSYYKGGMLFGPDDECKPKTGNICYAIVSGSITPQMCKTCGTFTTRDTCLSGTRGAYCNWNPGTVGRGECRASTRADSCGNYCYIVRMKTANSDTLGRTIGSGCSAAGTPNQSRAQCRIDRDKVISDNNNSYFGLKGRIDPAEAVEGSCGDTQTTTQTGTLDQVNCTEKRTYISEHTDAAGSTTEKFYPIKTADTQSGGTNAEAKLLCEQECTQAGAQCSKPCTESCRIQGQGIGINGSLGPSRLVGIDIGETTFKPIYEDVVENGALGGVGEKLYEASNGIDSFGSLINRLYRLFVWISIILAVGFLVRGGLTLALSTGTPKREQEAKKYIQNAIVGLLLIVGSYAILNTINPDILRLSILQDAVINTQMAGDEEGMDIEGGDYSSGTTPPVVGEGGDIKQLAQQVLDHPNITFDPGIENSFKQLVQSGVSVRSSAGGGGSIRVSPLLLKVVITAADYLKTINKPLRISSLTTGGHAKTSNHYNGTGIDIGNEQDWDPQLLQFMYKNKSQLRINELIYYPMPSGTNTLKHGKDTPYGASTINAHKNHLHFSVE